MWGSGESPTVFLMKSSALPSSVKTLNALSILSPVQEEGGAVRVSANDTFTLPKPQDGRWHPGLADQPLHSEIFASASEASGAALALALARDALRVAGQSADSLAEANDRRQILWVQDKRAVARGGRPCAYGLPRDLRDRLIHVETATPEDALFALEEGLKCRDFACVIGEIMGNPRAFGFTASRRLSLTAQKQGTALWLVRLEAEADLSSARMRWRAKSAPSSPPLWNSDAPGAPAWKAELFRARSHAPGKWILSNEDGRLSANPPDQTRPAASTPRSRGQSRSRAQNIGYLVRPTVGRSLAAVARA